MKAVRLHEFHSQPVIDDVPEPTISGPLDVIVKIGGAGACRTDLPGGGQAQRMNQAVECKDHRDQVKPDHVIPP